MTNAPSQKLNTPITTSFFDEATNTVSFVVRDPKGKACAIIDSVLDFDYSTGRTDTKSADKIIAYVQAEGLDVQWLLETHVHADHLSAAPYIQEITGGKIGIGDQIVVVQDTFGKIFNEGSEFQRDGTQFDALFSDGESIHIGQMRVDILHTPGHTPACMTFVAGDSAFVGDTLFMPDFGTARCDFPGGSSSDLFKSIQKILTLPDDTKIFVGHDYKAPGRDEFGWETTVAEQKARNIHIGKQQDQAGFCKKRDARDATLAKPKLIIPSLQVNMRAGNMPPADDQGDVFLKVPINKL